ncbi:MAG: efflux RND transporter periplasmic adaptor subunit [Candidatus Rokubacteria bacterium]|nr:efflux RND transporter periplasmic adaptor subunit [Candidatus Rokubacteria bacterium]
MTKGLRLVAAAVLLLAAGVVATWAVRGVPGDGRLAVTGTIEATQVDISAKITGRVVELRVREGQPVERGQLLARLDDAELTADARRAGSAVRAAEAELRNVEAGARREEIREAEARAARASAQLDDLLAGARAQEIEQARAALRNAAATREWTARDLKRAEELYGKELIAAQDVDRARQGWEVAAANETAAREKLALVEAGARQHEVEAARAELRAAQERVALLRAGSRPQEIEAARARLGEARAAQALVQARLEEARLVSPLTGVVLRKNVEAGETVNPGVSLLTLVDPNDLWVRAYVPETDIGRIRVGQAARVTVDAYPNRWFAGTISEVASEAEFTPKNVQTRKERVNLVFRIKVAVRNADGVLKPGMPADADLLP